MAKHQLPKLWLRVRFPPLAPKDLSVFFCGGNLADFVLPSFLLVPRNTLRLAPVFEGASAESPLRSDCVSRHLLQKTFRSFFTKKVFVSNTFLFIYSSISKGLLLQLMRQKAQHQSIRKFCLLN